MQPTRASHGLPDADAPIVRARNLSKRFGATQALSGVALEIQPGEVRALVGRNGAGKSTLVSVLTGLVGPDSGEIAFQGVPAPRLSEPDLWQSLVACVYQHPKLVPTMSCAENLFLSETLRGRKLISWPRLRREARHVLEQWGVDMDVDQEAGALTVGQRQLLEIARALVRGSRLVILDEPTAKLNGQEVERLFEQIRTLQSKGVAILFISHYLEEIFSLCQTVTVLRDGQRTLEGPIAALTRGELIEAMVGPADRSTQVSQGERAGSSSSVPDFSQAPVRLQVRQLSCRGQFEEVSFRVRAGECLGIAGLAGSGKEALGEALAGLTPWSAGVVQVDATKLAGGDVADHARAGVGFVPQDRHREGLVLGLSVAENATMTVSDRLGPFGFIRSSSREDLAGRMMRRLGIKSGQNGDPVSALSGGNQQKVVLARALARDPRVLVLIQPTSGVDVASKVALLSSIREVAERGAGILMISDELDELDLCDRVLVMRCGRLTREFVSPLPARQIVAEMEGVPA